MMRWWFLLIVLFTAPMLLGCAGKSPERIVTQEVKVLVPVPCRPDLGERPAVKTKEQITAALDAAQSFDDRVKIVAEQLALYIGWASRLEGAIKGCGTVPPPG